MTNQIPFLDLVTPHHELKEELSSVFESALNTGGFIGGPMVEHFEQDFARFCDSTYCVGVANGTDALRFALIATGIKSGDVVVTVPNTFIATGEAISQAGARPVFVDVDERTSNMDPEKLREYLEEGCRISDTGRPIDKKTGQFVAAVVPVHLYGQMCDMDAIANLAERYSLVLIEDACQAHGAEYFSSVDNRWRKAGTIGKAAAFSFYPGKNLGACGEAGAVTTNDPEVAKRIRMIRDHGQSRKYYHQIEGYNGRLDAIQAGILQVKLRHLAKWNEQRQQSAARYDKLLRSSKEVTLPFQPAWSRPVYHLYVIQVEDRVALQEHLTKAGIGSGIHYPVPLHLQQAYGHLGYRSGDFPIAEKKAEGILSLPMFPGLTAEDQGRVAEVIEAVLSRGFESALVPAGSSAND
jgi:dTDP-4-amino-4,6-dideoxygalactose transaminase